MNQSLFLVRAIAVLAAFAFSLSGCSGGGLAGDIISGRATGGQDEARIQVSAASTRVEADGGRISVEISNSGEGQMNWSASLDSAWASIEGDASGEGRRKLTLVFEANAQASERTVILSVSSRDATNSPQSVTITQSAAEPEPVPQLSASADRYTLSADGGTVTVDLANEGGGELDWSAMLSSDAPWVRFIGRNAGRGDSSLQIEVDSNSTEERRSFQLIVTAEGAEQSPQTLHFSQEQGTGAPKSSLTVSAASYDIDSGGATVQVTVEAGNSVAWTAALGGDADWAHFSGPSSGTGEGNVSIRVDANAQQETRSFELTVSANGDSSVSQTLSFVQEASSGPSADSIEISAASYDIDSGGATVQVTVEAGNSVAWTAALGGDADWAHFSGPSSGTGEGNVSIRVDANAQQETRSFELTVSANGDSSVSQTLSFVQEASSGPSADSIEISAASYDIDSGGATVQVTVEAGNSVAWTAALGGDADWAHFSGPSSGTGEGNVSIRVDANAQQETRSFELTVSANGDSSVSQTLSFVQEAADSAVISLSAVPADRSIGHTGGTVRVDISNSGGGRLNWSASTDAAWASIAGTPSGTNSGSVIVSVLENGGPARAFTVTVQAAEAQNSPRTIRFTQAAAAERARDSARIHANRYALSHLGETVTVNIDVSGEAQLNWSANILRADSTYVVLVPELDEEGNDTGRSTEETRDRGEWVRLLGNSSGTGSGELQLQVDRNPVALRWSFSLSFRFPDAPELDQTLHFSQDYEAEQRLTLWTASRHIGAGGETLDVHLNASSGGLVYWVASVDVDWAHLEGVIDGEIDGNGTALIRIEVDANPGDERSFDLTVEATNAQSPPPLTFRQAVAQEMEGGVPAPPPPPVWYANECQRQTPGFEEFGGWLAERRHYLNESDSRVWRHMTDGHESNAPTLRAFTDCTEDKRRLTTNILADAMLDEPAEFANLPLGVDARIVLLDTVIPKVGEHTNGARHEDPEHVWSDAGSGWYPTFTRNGSGAKFLHLQPLGDWGYENASGWRTQVSDWNTAGSDMSAWTDAAREFGWRLPSIQERTGEGLRMLANTDTALWLLVGGYTGSGPSRRIHPNSAVCGDAKQLCLFAPWEYEYTNKEGTLQVASGTAIAAAQVAAALDNVLLLWPNYDLLDLRDLVLDCAEDLGDEGPDAMWGRGVLSFNCLFTAQGDLRDPRTNTILSGGIYGPMQGLSHGGSAPTPSLTGANVPGIDRTGREFLYPVLRWSNQDNHALLVASGFSGDGPTASLPRAHRSYSAALLEDGPFSARIAAVGDAVGAIAQWRAGGFLSGSGLWTFRGGLALQQEGAGSLRGERVFRAPATLSSTFSFAFQHHFTTRLALHLQGNYWVTLDTKPRSLWAGAQLSELRASAAIAYQSSRFNAVLQAQYGGGLAGRLDVAGRTIRLTPSSARHLSLRIRIPFKAP